MFVLHLAAAFGIGFQVPVVVAFLASLGIATAGDMARLRRYVWFGMAILSAFITPPDVTSMLFLLLPMALLFEVGLIVAKFIEKSRSVE
ncbi:MAG: twin-arginine translocase subunit TatC [Planctomycetota bacterium]|nr:MAG: twin-arginine translocase subunit TatC [Planctomycetota bacterium]